MKIMDEAGTKMNTSSKKVRLIHPLLVLPPRLLKRSLLFRNIEYQLLSLTPVPEKPLSLNKFDKKVSLGSTYLS